MTGSVQARGPAGTVQPDAQDGDDYETFEGQAGSGGQDGSQGARQAGSVDDAAGQDAEGTEDEDLAGLVEDDLAEFFPDRQPAPPSRAQTRIQRLQSEVQELRRRLTQPAVQPVQAAPAAAQVPGIETEEQFQARLALLNPEDRIDARLARQQALFDHRERVREFNQQQREQQNQMALDRERFTDKVERDPRYKRWADRVEEKHQEFARQGQFVPREAVFRYLLGDHLLTREGSQEARRQTQRGKQRVERQTVRPGNPGSDVGGGRRQVNEREARARRLEGVQI